MLILLVLACSGKSPATDDSLSNEPDPRIELSASELEFGTLALDGRSHVEQTLTVTNAGGGVLALTSRTLDLDDSSPFSIEAPSVVALGAGQSTDLSLSFAALEPDEVLDTLRLSSNDPLAPEVTVALSGSGEGPVIGLDPSESADLGATVLGCEGLLPVAILNLGNADLEVTAVQLSGDASFAVDLLPATNGVFPWTIPPGGSKSVQLSYAPSEATTQSATLRVNSSDGLRPAVELALTASGQSFGQIEDHFTADAKIDVVFAIDSTSGNQAPLNQLQDDITLMTDHMRRESVDGQVSAVVADNGCVQGGTVAFTPAMGTTDQRQAFAAMTSGSPGTLAQQPFNLLSAAITASGSGGCDAGMLRTDAVAAFVGFSSRDDQSGNSARVSVEALQAQLSRPSRLVFSAIAGDVPSGCGSATSATTMNQAVTLTDGVFSSICDSNYRAPLEDIVDAAATRALGSYRLSATPVQTSLHVELRGVERSTGWSYDEEERAIFFDTSARPSLGDSVVVRYEASAERCE